MKRILQILEIAAKGLLVAAVVLWVGDWAAFRVQTARGKGLDTVEVQQFLGTPLKGNKTEYDYMGTAQVSCARAIFPHGGIPACWWVRRHKEQWQ